MIAIVKDLLIYLTVIAAIIVIPIQLGGYGKIFAAVPPAKLLLAPPPAGHWGAYSAYATLALGSACALFLYPHSITGVLSASSRARDPAQRGDAAGLFVGAGAARAARLHGDRRGRAADAGIRRRLQTVRQQLRGAGAAPVRCSRPGSSASPSPRSPSARWCRRRSCRSPRRTSSPATSTASSSSPPAPTPRKARSRRCASLVIKVGALVFIFFIPLQVRDLAAAAGRGLDHPDAARGGARAVHPLASTAGRC